MKLLDEFLKAANAFFLLNHSYDESPYLNLCRHFNRKSVKDFLLLGHIFQQGEWEVRFEHLMDLDFELLTQELRFTLFIRQ